MRGGKRPGAGRPKGAATRRTRAIVEAAAEAGLQPLEMMLQAARQFWAEALDRQGRIVDRKLALAAAQLARDAAPYVHPRLTSVEANVKHDLSRLSDADLDAKLAALLAGGAGGAAAGEGEESEAPPVTH